MSETTIDSVSTVESISELLNTPKGWKCSLNELLLDVIEWSEVAPGTIIPKLELRSFTKSIHDKEIRMDVMKFLFDNAEYYFSDGARELAWEGERAINKEVLEERIRVYIGQFRSELSAQISQIEKLGLYSGNRFSKLEKQVAQLKEDNEQYKKANQFLQEKIDRFERPEKYNKYIPSELQNSKFGDIMKYLQSAEIALPIYTDGSYGRLIACFQWHGGKSLFGYFVIHVSDALNLKKGRDTYNWQLFEPAINNYDDLIKEARKAISTCKKQKTKIEKSEKIDEAIQFAIQKAESEKH